MSWAARPYPSEFAVADVLPLPYRAKDAPWEKVSAGRRRLELFSNEKTGEHVWMEDWDAGARVEDTVSKGYVNCSDAIGPWLTRLCLSRGEETFVVRGAFTERVGDSEGNRTCTYYVDPRARLFRGHDTCSRGGCGRCAPSHEEWTPTDGSGREGSEAPF